MTLIDVETNRTSGLTLYAFPSTLSLATWATNRVQLVEAASPNQGRYTAQLDDTLGTLWRLFSGASQPANWAASIEYFDLAKPVFVVSGNVTTTSPVATDGTLTSPVIIGDDYLSANSRAFIWDLDAVPGVTLATATCFFGGSRNGAGWLVSGAVTDNGDGTWKLTFELAKTATQDLAEGYYEWSVEVRSAGGTEVTRVKSGVAVELTNKQT
jgi:hypothetical protein